MKPKLLLVLLLLILINTGWSQDSLPPVFEIRNETAFDLPDSNWRMLEDPSGKLGIEAIRSPVYLKNFHKNNTAETGAGYSGVKDYWQWFRLRNISGKDQTIVLGETVKVMQTDVYAVRANGKIDHLRNGWGVPLSQRDSFPTSKTVPIKIGKDEELTIFMKSRMYRMDFRNNLRVQIRFFDQFIREEYVYQPVYVADTRAAFVAGMLILGFFLNLVFFLIVREKVYLWFSLFLLLEGIWYLSLGTRLFLKENPSLLPLFDVFITYSFFFFSVTQFVRYFLKTFKYYKKWDRFLLLSIILNIAIQIARQIVDATLPYSMKGISGGIQNLVFFVCNFSLLISFFLPKKEKDPFTTLSVIAAVPAFFIWSVGYGIQNLYNFLLVRYNTPKPAWLRWIDSYLYLIESIAVAWFALLFTYILMQRFSSLRKQLTQSELAREKEKTELMARQKIELEKQVEERTAELKKTITNLQTTQQQLIQSEKMASLGELTAGIAHEIQNPLNFVNNFSDVNTELIDEMNEQLAKGNLQQAKEISESIRANEEKIIIHGKRADAIVKSMLQHSRTSSGKKEPADINALTDEYLRLSYHGLRAKDKTFNASFETQLDPAVGKLEIVSQEIGRVLLNLINNAFYAVTEKKKNQQDGSYDPKVIVQTKKEKDKVVITVSDNGKGIPKSILDKVFQPFFTTKPAGEGTGLGLSLAYDTIVNGHGGDLQVETKEGEGTSFIISLPLNHE